MNSRSFRERRWVVKDSKSVDEVLRTATEQLNDMTTGTLAAVWAAISRLLSTSHPSKNPKKNGCSDVTDYEPQIHDIIEYTILSADILSLKELATIILAMAKVIKNVRTAQEKGRVNAYQRAFRNVFIDDESFLHRNYFEPLSDAANAIITSDDTHYYETRHLTNIAYAFALIGYNPKVGRTSTLLENIADTSIDRVQEFNDQNIGNTAWAYATLKLPNEALFQAMGDAVVDLPDLVEFFNPQAFSNTVWAYSAMNMHHPGLFKKVGDAIVAMENLKSFNPQNLANTVWAFANMDVQYPALYAKIGDTIVASDDLKSFSISSLSSIVWAYATANIKYPGLFETVGDAIASSRDLKSCTSKACSLIVWAYATADKKHPEMFKKVGDVAAASVHLEAVMPRTISTILWSYATTNTQHSVLFEKFGDAIVGIRDLSIFRSRELATVVFSCAIANIQNRAVFKSVGDAIIGFNDLSTFEYQDIANAAWAYCVSNVHVPLLFNTSFIDYLVSNEHEFSTENLSQLHQWHLWQTKELLHVGLPKSFASKCHEEFVCTRLRSSNLQKEVVDELISMGLKPVEEYLTKTGYRLDAMVQINSKIVGIDVDGPYHFFGRRPNGRTLLKRRQVSAIDGIPLLSVPYWEWNKSRDRAYKRKYLQSLLKSFLK